MLIMFIVSDEDEDDDEPAIKYPGSNGTEQLHGSDVSRLFHKQLNNKQL